jgi:putative tryptophan/tyrosine transport system substrate-binding protein
MLKAGNSPPKLTGGHAVQIKRRDVLAALGLLVTASPDGYAQEKKLRVGVLWPGASPPAAPRMESFRQTLNLLGFVEGQNVETVLRYAGRGLEQVPDLAADLVRQRVNVITTFGDYAPRVAREASQEIPIVVISDDVVGAGLVSSLSAPGGNTTGLTILSPELSAKRLEILREVLPGISRIAVLWDPTTGVSQVAASTKAAHSLNLELNMLRVKDARDLGEAFKMAKSSNAEAINVSSSPFLASLSTEIIRLAAQFSLPTIYQWREHVEAGGLISYGPGLATMFRQAAIMVSRILKGVSPAAIPVEQPTCFELVVNATTTKSLGLMIPREVLLRADDVID